MTVIANAGHNCSGMAVRCSVCVLEELAGSSFVKNNSLDGYGGVLYC